MEDINKLTPADIGYSIAKAGVSSLPIVGAMASELMGLLMTAPMEKRKQKLLEDLGRRLKKLEAKGLDLNSLCSNDQFIDVASQAMILALKTSEEEKILAFKNAILNTAEGQAPDKIRSQIFLNILDTFSIWHVQILNFFNDPHLWYKSSEMRPPSPMASSLSRVLKEAYPHLKAEDQLLDVIWNDLASAGFHNSGNLKTMMTGESLFESRTTDLGKQFLRFISESE